MGKRILVIAEAGINHNGNMEIAKKMIDVASEAGADFVKFQTFNSDRLVTSSARKADYQIDELNKEESQKEMLKRVELTEAMHFDLKSHCVKRNIGFLSSAFDIESINFLVSLGQSFFKIPSSEITNLPYLRHIGKIDKSIILSTGMSTIDEIEDAIRIIHLEGTLKKNITILHCTTEYPAPFNEVNLKAMQTIHKALDLDVGYSDHTLGIEVAIAAVAMGAKIIEKHFTLDRNMLGPDHKASLQPEELKAMITAIRNIEVALGDGIKKPTSREIKNKKIARKSIVAKQFIKAGEKFTEKNITSKRPANGLSPMKWDDVIGSKAIRDFSIDELIKLN